MEGLDLVVVGNTEVREEVCQRSHRKIFVSTRTRGRVVGKYLVEIYLS